jgi:hypothetical protein
MTGCLDRMGLNDCQNKWHVETQGKFIRRSLPSTSFTEAGRQLAKKTGYRVPTATPPAGLSIPERARYATVLLIHRRRRRDWKVAYHRSPRGAIYKERNIVSFTYNGKIWDRSGKD